MSSRWTFFFAGVVIGIAALLLGQLVANQQSRVVGHWTTADNSLRLSVYEDLTMMMILSDSTPGQKTVLMNGRLIKLNDAAFKIEISEGEKVFYFRLDVVSASAIEVTHPNGSMVPLQRS